jgi:signal transduction histidine kinase
VKLLWTPAAVRTAQSSTRWSGVYSGKGEEGRGLGLYIARQLLERHDYTIELADLKSHKVLSGANFVVSFVHAEE